MGAKDKGEEEGEEAEAEEEKKPDVGRVSMHYILPFLHVLKKIIRYIIEVGL